VPTASERRTDASERCSFCIVKPPKDKASVENTVGNIATAVIARMRAETPVGLDGARAAVLDRMREYNDTPFQKRRGSRTECFLGEELPALRPLPAFDYEVCEWVRGRKAQRNGHVCYAKNYYSVPYRLVGTRVDLRVTDAAVEVYSGSERVATHPAAPPGACWSYSTQESHLPKGGAYEAWDRKRIEEWARRVGPSCREVVARILEEKEFEAQAFNPTLSIPRLSRAYGQDRLEAACGVALASGVRCPKHANVKQILETAQDAAVGEDPAPARKPSGGYLRGAEYYGGI
jgi:hypothetical protein